MSARGNGLRAKIGIEVEERRLVEFFVFVFGKVAV